MSYSVNAIIDYEMGLLDEKATIALFQELLDSGMVWSLQGHYGRTAKWMLGEGMITQKAKEKNERA